MILLCLLILGAPAVPGAKPASAASAPAAIDWANHDYNMFTLRGGSAEIREYPMDGTPHDSQRWQFVRAESVRIAGVASTIVLITAAYSSPEVSRESLTAYLFRGDTQIGQPIAVPTASAQIKVDGDFVMGVWRVGTERYVQAWRATAKGLVSIGKAPNGSPYRHGGYKRR